MHILKDMFWYRLK